MIDTALLWMFTEGIFVGGLPPTNSRRLEISPFVSCKRYSKYYLIRPWGKRVQWWTHQNKMGDYLNFMLLPCSYTMMHIQAYIKKNIGAELSNVSAPTAWQRYIKQWCLGWTPYLGSLFGTFLFFCFFKSDLFLLEIYMCLD